MACRRSGLTREWDAWPPAFAGSDQSARADFVSVARGFNRGGGNSLTSP